MIIINGKMAILYFTLIVSLLNSARSQGKCIWWPGATTQCFALCSIHTAFWLLLMCQKPQPNSNKRNSAYSAVLKATTTTWKCYQQLKSFSCLYLYYCFFPLLVPHLHYNILILIYTYKIISESEYGNMLRSVNSTNISYLNCVVLAEYIDAEQSTWTPKTDCSRPSLLMLERTRANAFAKTEISIWQPMHKTGRRTRLLRWRRNRSRRRKRKWRRCPHRFSIFTRSETNTLCSLFVLVWLFVAMFRFDFGWRPGPATHTLSQIHSTTHIAFIL